jgi:hypothetical protein
MEEKKENGKEETCGKGGCGIHCGCCACKAIKAVVLLLIGGVVGFMLGHSCRGGRMCVMSAPMQMQNAAKP